MVGITETATNTKPESRYFKKFINMKNSITFLFHFVSIYLVAQPVLNSTDINLIGSVNRFTASPIGFTVGPNGANQTWDYSSLTLTPIGTYNQELVTSSPFSATFPAANYTIKIPNPSNDYYLYYMLNSSKFELLGFADSTTITNFSSNPITEFEFPFTYNLTINDSYADINNPTSSHQFSILYDAYGTLITPFGTFTNIYRTKKIENSIYPEYAWYNQNTNKAILTVSIGSSASTTLVTFYQHTNLSITEYENNKTVIYPNPASENITIQNPENQTEKLNYKIIDLTGRIIKSENSNYNQIINIADLTTGNYIIEIKEQNGNTSKKKFIKN